MTRHSHGPTFLRDGRVRFEVWAPRMRSIAVRISGREHPLEPREGGWFAAEVSGAGDGARYELVLEDGRNRPDPASRRQPDGVHGPSQLFDPARHAWRDGAWKGLPREALVFYELHAGTFTPEGTLDAGAARLPDLVDLGVTCVELMPVQPFPGARNWGYDGVELYAVHEAYGGPVALQRFVDRAHGLGLAVCLDVVYNHLGPEGNYLGELAPYFTNRHRSPWGDGLDFDGRASGPVRGFMIGAAVQWIRDFHVDALRLDATHAIPDDSPSHLVAELGEAVRAAGRAAGREVHVVAENDENDRKVLDPPPRGWGASAVWADDLHHALHALVTGERQRFLGDFGRPEDVSRALAEGFVYQGQRSSYRKRGHGTDVRGLPPSRFVTCLQNHDQVGNRPRGERLSTLVPFDALYPLSTLVVLGAGLPLLFMGEEYGEQRPFLYFTSHGDPALAKAVSEGRKNEFIAEGEEEVPDPQEEETFVRSKLTHRRDGRHGALREHYRRLLAVRRTHRAEITGEWPLVECEGTAFSLVRPGLVVRANLGASPAGGLPAWGVEIEERGPARTEGAGPDPRAQAAASGDPPHLFQKGEGLAE
ncbi:malto-oligosyltrehalose trehalohydrolase [Anaeromyxobacter sp. Fw109-5]|uniref:malto-oligosyltrehalose trehalohydrolase n=1 Tax=Anaeromyxobacter sp. (strain Fw109-5) TaxID=404589 RepID=UPI0000ED6F0D|nr:malto-oligosyltrehalose trehalohydrolase [Anaeromyxobacter sp. Fw109-5]ABS27981.1 malto-oligosyltrehalose trehalohydrolase [Anaeromyxobacter sp. Fw109-5]